MRLLIASAAALLAVAFAAPSFAQDETPIAPPAPTAKPKPGTSAYCQTLKSASSRSSCLKKVSAQSKAAPTKTAKAKTKKPTTTTTAPKQPDSAQLAPPVAEPSSSGTGAVPPLPQKTI